MKKKFNQVYQFKILLKDIRPPVWRRIQVPETCTFWDLHVAIQDAMGWTDRHLHEFELKIDPTGEMDVRIGIPDDDVIADHVVLAGWKLVISKIFSREHNKAEYTDDFGDEWTHEILLEQILPREKGVVYPLCIDGRRACPPEDCGGPPGYEDFLEIIMDPRNEQYHEMLDRVGGDFEPERFNAKDVFFDNPKERLKALRD